MFANFVSNYLLIAAKKTHLSVPKPGIQTDGFISALVQRDPAGRIPGGSPVREGII